MFCISDSSSIGETSWLGELPPLQQIGTQMEVVKTALWFHPHDGIRKIKKKLDLSVDELPYSVSQPAS
jgi:hypothetical protein